MISGAARCFALSIDESIAANTRSRNETLLLAICQPNELRAARRHQVGSAALALSQALSHFLYDHMPFNSAGMAVGLGAFGAHGLKKLVTPERLDVRSPSRLTAGIHAPILQVWDTASRYHLIHSVAVCFCAAKPQYATAGKLLLGGIGLFSGSLYALVLTDIKPLGNIDMT